MNSIMTYDEWLSENGHDVERIYQLYHDEYGDAMNLLSDFKQQKYRDYVDFQQRKQNKMNMMEESYHGEEDF